MKDIANKVFFVSENSLNPIVPPQQVFKNSAFDKIITIGGGIADSDFEYEKLMSVLREIGENEFSILENFGATIDEDSTHTIPYSGKLSTNSDLNDFRKLVANFQPEGFWSAYHYFVFGDLPNWGIYIAEYPTILIIGCAKELSEKFRYAYSVSRNGLDEELKDFIRLEFGEERADMETEFYKNYID